jgi:hypothetical protein
VWHSREHVDVYDPVLFQDVLESMHEERVDMLIRLPILFDVCFFFKCESEALSRGKLGD